MDVRLPPTFTDEGLQAALEARRKVPGLPVLVLSQHVEQLYARELLADGAGAIGYLLKDRVLNSDQFVDAVRRVADGGTVQCGSAEVGEHEVHAGAAGEHVQPGPRPAARPGSRRLPGYGAGARRTPRPPRS